MSGPRRISLIVGAALAVSVAVVLVLRDRDAPTRRDALVRAVPGPAAPESSAPADEDPYAALRGLMIDENNDPRREIVYSRQSDRESRPPGAASPSDIVAFWQTFGDHLTRVGIEPRYVEALRATYGTTEPRSFVAADSTEIAGALMTWLNAHRTPSAIFLVTEREAAALQTVAGELLSGER